MDTYTYMYVYIYIYIYIYASPGWGFDNAGGFLRTLVCLH